MLSHTMAILAVNFYWLRSRKAPGVLFVSLNGATEFAYDLLTRELLPASPYLCVWFIFSPYLCP